MRNLIIILSLAIAAAACSNASTNWKENYGIDPECNNPVFIQPSHTVPGGRVHGAGIEMDDGKAYRVNYISFSTEYHYAPKISLSKVEVAQMRSIIGVANLPDILKFSVKPLNGCRAVVIYRDHRAYRDQPNAGQVMATFDEHGKVIDVMTMGQFYDIEEIFTRGQNDKFTAKPNSGGRTLKYGSTPNSFTISTQNSWNSAPKNEYQQWKEVREYIITDDGHFVLKEVKEDNRPPLDNNTAWTLQQAMLMPASATEAALDSLEAIAAKVKGDTLLEQKYQRVATQCFFRNRTAYLTWAYRHQDSPLAKDVKALCRSFYTPDNPDDSLEWDITNITDEKAKRFWLDKLQTTLSK